MQFTLKRLLLWFIPLGILAAIMQRPVRDLEFQNAFLVAFYPWLWLSYREDWVHAIPHGSGTAGVGMLLGTVLHIASLFAAIFAVVCLLNPPSNDSNR